MPTRHLVTVSCAVEGSVDEAILRRIIEDSGGILGAVYGMRGKSLLRQRIQGYNNAARRAPWIVLADLDHDAECAPPFRDAWLERPAAKMCFRVAVREVEAWLLADRKSLARFLGVSSSIIPSSPESSENPKQELVNLARRSKRPAIQKDMVPRPRSGHSIGPAYSSRLIEFVRTRWQPQVAESNSDSLRRCRIRISELIGKIES